MSKNVRSLGAGLCIVFMGTMLAGCATSGPAQSTPTDVLLGDTSAKPLTIMVHSGIINSPITASGTVVGVKQRQLYFTFNGKVKKLYTSQGKSVNEGDPIVELEDDGVAKRIEQQQINVDKAQISLDQLQSDPKSDPYAIQLAKLDVQEAQDNLSQLQKHQADLTLRAPYGGIITGMGKVNNPSVPNQTADLQVGDDIQAYTPYVTLAAPGAAQVVCSGLLQQQAQYIAPGQAVAVSDPRDNGSYDGTVAGMPIEVKSNDPTQPTTYELYVNVQKLPESMLNNQVSITITTQTRLNALLVPQTVLHQGIEGPYVELWKNGRRQQTLVQVGVQSGKDAEILSGLKTGDEVIVGN